MSSSINIASYLPAMAARQPDTLAVAFPLGRDGAGKQRYLRWTYRQLEEESNTIARGLQAIGITRSMRTVLMVKPSPEFFALVFAIFKIGAVLVGVDPGMGVKNLKTCLAEAEPQAFIGIRKAHVARRLLGWAKKTNRINVLVGRKLLPFGKTISLDSVRHRGSPASHSKPLAPVLAQTQPDETAAILFTSGSTGIPKGVVYTHNNFDAQVRALRDQYDIQPGEIDLCTFPLFALYAPALGMSAIVPKMDFTKPGSVEPRDIIEPILEFNVTNMFGSPALLKQIAPQARELKLPCLRRVISAGAPVPSRTIACITKLLAPNVQLFTPYGATESLPVCSIGSDEILRETAALTDQGKGVCIGRPVPSIDLRIIRISDEPIAQWSDDLEVKPGEIGEITVRGPQVTRSYFNRDSSTNLAKIRIDLSPTLAPGGSRGLPTTTPTPESSNVSAATPDFRRGLVLAQNDESHHADFFHRMGDLGYRDEQGRVWFCGRKSERVITKSKTYFTAQIEELLANEFGRNALVGVVVGSSLPIAHQAMSAEGLMRHRQRFVEPVICVECPPLPKGMKWSLQPWSETFTQLHNELGRHELTRDIKHILRYPRPFPTDIRHNSKINRPLLAKWAAKQLGGEPA